VTYAITLTNLGFGNCDWDICERGHAGRVQPGFADLEHPAFCSSPGAELAPEATIKATAVYSVLFSQGTAQEDHLSSAGASVASDNDSSPTNNTAKVVTRIVGPHGFSG
jgi:hypothetical protein